jgi:3-oxoacyl-[acyl-carrier protein] reductase
MDALAKTTAVVTGASRGIGRAIARLFARNGAAVAGCARGTHAGSFLDDLTLDERKRCQHMRCDVRVAGNVDRFRAEVQATLGAPDIVVNNAGIVARASLVDLSVETWNDVLAANLTGTFLVTRAFLPAMKARGRGRIINLASISGRTGTPMLSAYCAAKHGVVGLTRALAEEVRADGIVVNAICPGSVDTEMLGQGMPGAAPRMTADAIAQVALFLAHQAPLALTGVCLDVFG